MRAANGRERTTGMGTAIGADSSRDATNIAASQRRAGVRTSTAIAEGTRPSTPIAAGATIAVGMIAAAMGCRTGMAAITGLDTGERHTTARRTPTESKGQSARKSAPASTGSEVSACEAICANLLTRQTKHRTAVTAFEINSWQATSGGGWGSYGWRCSRRGRRTTAYSGHCVFGSGRGLASCGHFLGTGACTDCGREGACVCVEQRECAHRCAGRGWWRERGGQQAAAGECHTDDVNWGARRSCDSSAIRHHRHVHVLGTRPLLAQTDRIIARTTHVGGLKAPDTWSWRER